MNIRQILGIHDKDFYRKLFLIAIPIMIQQLINTAMYMVDTVMVGGLGEIALAGLNAANSITLLLDAVVIGIVSGCAVFASQYHGKNDQNNIQSILGLSLVLTTAFTSLFVLMAQLFPGPFINLFIDDPTVIEVGTKYLKISSFGYLTKGVIMSYAMVNRCSGKAVMPMIAGLGALIINMVFNYLLIYGKLGAPALGVQGTAIATLSGLLVNTIILVTISNVKKTAAHGSVKQIFSNCFCHFAPRMRIVIPVLLDDILWGIGVSIISAIYGRMGTDAFAAIAIFNTMDKLTYVVLAAAANACGVTLGNLIGEGDLARAEEYSRRYRHLMIVAGIFLGAVLIVGGLLIPNAFDVSEQVKKLASLTIIALGLIITLMCYNFVIIIGTIRSGGDTLFAAIADLLPLWLVQIPMLYLLGIHFKLPLYIAYLAVVPTELLRFLLGRSRLKKKKWLNNVT